MTCYQAGNLNGSIAMTEPLWAWDAVDLAQAIRTRAISANEAVAAALDRLAAVNPKINAVVQVLADDALAAADAADAKVRRGEPLGSLHGVPVTIKVNVDQAGCATTNGVVAFRDNIAAADSPPVANWKKAGAIIIGRTNTPAFSWRWFTDNDLHGRTLNPWNSGITPGGSSGGAAAGLAAGIGALAHGNDIGGSIRYPAYVCGLVGIRPSLGRVPSFNPTAPEERPLTAQIASVQGPLARRVKDLRAGLAAMSAFDPRDPWWVPAPLDGPPPPRPIRVAMCVDPGGGGVAPPVAAAVRQAAAWLAEAGYAIEEKEPPHFAEAVDLWHATVGVESRLTMLPLLEKYGDDAVKRMARAFDAQVPGLDLVQFGKALARRSTLLRAWMVFFEDYPLILMPVSCEPPFPNGFDQGGEAALRKLLTGQRAQFPPATLGLPGISVPTGLAGGVPMGVQLIAGRYREDLLLAAAEIIEARGPMATPIDPRP
jgi:amidase